MFLSVKSETQQSPYDLFKQDCGLGEQLQVLDMFIFNIISGVLSFREGVK